MPIILTPIYAVGGVAEIIDPTTAVKKSEIAAMMPTSTNRVAAFAGAVALVAGGALIARRQRGLNKEADSTSE